MKIGIKLLLVKLSRFIYHLESYDVYVYKTLDSYCYKNYKIFNLFNKTKEYNKLEYKVYKDGIWLRNLNGKVVNVYRNCE